MSSQRGNVARNRPQKYQNTSKFKNNLHDKSDKTKKLNEVVISDCCARCTEIIQWKITFKKYKLLSQPKKCVICLEKKVKNSYHIICSECGSEDSLCRKCKIKFTPECETEKDSQKNKIKEKKIVSDEKENIDEEDKSSDESIALESSTNGCMNIDCQLTQQVLEGIARHCDKETDVNT